MSVSLPPALLRILAAACMLAATFGATTPAGAAEREATRSFGERLTRVVLLQDYNTRVVLLGTLLLGIAGGVVGTFMLLRKRALVGDVVGHAALPGIAIAFLVMELIEPGSGKSLPGLLWGAFISGLTGALCALAIGHLTRIKEDAALAIVLSIFFGVGVALFTVVQRIPTGNVAGLHQFVFGKTSSMLAEDVAVFAWLAGGVILACGLLFKELTVLCFDQDFAGAQGWPVLLLDALLMGLIVSVTVIGLQSVGLLLVVALPVIPAAAARFWTDNIARMGVIAAGIGGLSSVGGVVVSAMFPRLATGPLIVIAGSVLFLFSLLFGAQRGVVRRWWHQSQLRRRIGRDDLMRACYEHLERDLPDGLLLRPESMVQRTISVPSLLRARTWPPSRVERLIRRAVRDGLLRPEGESVFRLTDAGVRESVRATRNHRLWELFLIRYADIAPSHVDRDADLIEHVLGPEMMQDLEAALGSQYPHLRVPESPHTIAPAE